MDAEIIAGIVALLSALGAAGKYIWDKIDYKLCKLQAETEDCLEREKEALIRGASQITIIELLWIEVKRFDPNSETLKRAKTLLDELKREQQKAKDRING